MLGLLEDSGYLPRVVMLLDGIMVKLGLHGHDNPHDSGNRLQCAGDSRHQDIGVKRQRIILATMIVMVVPCSAQTVIIRTVGQYSGIAWAALHIHHTLLLILLLGRVLHRVLRAEPQPCHRDPRSEHAFPAQRAGEDVDEGQDFFVIAFPLLLVGAWPSRP